MADLTSLPAELADVARETEAAGSLYPQQIVGLTRRRIEIFNAAGDDWRFAESLRAISEDTAQEYEDRTIVELLQNGHDALTTGEPGRIRIILDLSESPGTLYVANDGKPFIGANFRSITELALSDKGAGEGIGNKGLGFRSVLQLSEHPEIYSQDPDDPTDRHFHGYSFRFARPEDIRDLTLAGDLVDRGRSS
jgi:hypothetical protein